MATGRKGEKTRMDRWFRKVMLLTIIFWVLAFAFFIWADYNDAMYSHVKYGFMGVLYSFCSSFFASIAFYFLCALWGALLDWLKKPISIHIDKY